MTDRPSESLSRWIPVGDLRIHTRIWRPPNAVDAVPIVMVHGLGVSGRYMIPTADLLADHHPVLVPDLPGFGQSDRPRHAISVDELAESLSGWMDGVEIDRAVMVANSLGCQVVVSLALSHPDRIDRLILQGPTTDPYTRSPFRQLLRLGVDAFLEPPALLPVVLRDYIRCGFRRAMGTFHYSLADPIEDKLPRVQSPTLVVRGSRDPLVSQRWAEEAARLLPHGRLAVIRGAAHAINFSRPDEYSHLIRSFLASDSTPPR